jgi:hypothetical protein
VEQGGRTTIQLTSQRSRADLRTPRALKTNHEDRKDLEEKESVEVLAVFAVQKQLELEKQGCW